VHEFLNGEYYLCPSSAHEIVDSLVTLRDKRRDDLYRLILTTLNTVLISIANDERYGPAVLYSDKRPFGKDSESCSVWVISLQCVLQEAICNQYQKDGRPSILSLMEPSLMHIPFPFSIELLKDAIKYFEYPYGLAVDINDVTFPRCDCIDDSGIPNFHMKCIKPAIIIAKHLYTEEEVVRRNSEYEESMTVFGRVEYDVDVWLEIQEGKKLLNAQVSVFKNHWRLNRSLNDELISDDKRMFNRLTAKVALLCEQMTKFETGEAFSKPMFKTMEEAQNILAKENESLSVLHQRLERLKELDERLQGLLYLSNSKIKELAVVHLKQKYCYIEYYEVLLLKYRRIASTGKLDRPWDGEDGAEYLSWWRMHVHDAEEVIVVEDEVGGSKLTSGGRRREVKEVQDGSDDMLLELLPEFNWEGCEEVDGRYKFALYDTFKASKGLPPN
jgi:hypothetical protein